MMKPAVEYYCNDGPIDRDAKNRIATSDYLIGLVKLLADPNFKDDSTTMANTAEDITQHIADLAGEGGRIDGPA